jgi:hypothetical protein
MGCPYVRTEHGLITNKEVPHSDACPILAETPSGNVLMFCKFLDSSFRLVLKGELSFTSNLSNPSPTLLDLISHSEE